MTMLSAFQGAVSLVVDLMLLPFAVPAALLLKYIRKHNSLSITRRMLRAIGIIPVRHHYYEPFVSRATLKYPTSNARQISGLDLNIEHQLSLLNFFCYADELRVIPLRANYSGDFGFINGMFEGGDAEYLYSMVRHFRPSRIIEVGGGHSTLITQLAIAKNQAQFQAYQCEHVVFEPFENSWLEASGAKIDRKKVEDADLAVFEALQEGDILFIDSSHVVRCQGDVLHLFFSVFGRLQPGVLVHLHDIFTPEDYPELWIADEQRIWTEQYLLEAFLAYNHDFEVIGSVNHLWKTYPDQFLRACPMLPECPRQDPGSFWFRRRKPGSSLMAS